MLSADIALLNQRIGQKDSIIMDYQRKDGNNEAIITALQEQKGMMELEKKVYLQQVQDFEKLLRKERRKRFWTAAGGIITTGLAAYLYITK